MEDPKEIYRPTKEREDKKVNLSVAQKLWRLCLAGTFTGSVLAASERGYSYLFSDVRLAEKVNDIDAFLSMFGTRLGTFRSPEAEEALGLSRAHVLNLSEQYQVNINWKILGSLPDIEKLRGASLILIITDDVLSPRSIGPEFEKQFEDLRRQARNAGVPEENVIVGGLASEIGGIRMFLPGIDDFVVILPTYYQVEMPIGDRSKILSASLVHEIAHIIDFKSKGIIMRVLEHVRDSTVSFQGEEGFAGRYVENNKELWAGVLSVKPVEAVAKFSPEELGIVNDILIRLQVETQTRRYEPTRPYWKKGIEA